MKLIQSKDINLNYAAKIVDIKEFMPHPNPEVTGLKCAIIDGYSITVDKTSECGQYIYFPVNSVINTGFLSKNNLFRDATLNQDSTQTGYFDDKGRVKMIKLQKVYSEGLILPISSIEKWLGTTIEVENNTVFDFIDNIEFCKKYVIKVTNKGGLSCDNKRNKHNKSLKQFDRMIDGQFNFHYSTVNLKNCPFVISPNDLIHISSKFHGTSGISSNILVKKELSLLEKCIKFLFPKLPIEETKYDGIYSSRTVIKNKFINKSVTGGYYNVDIWKIADEQIKTILGEIPKGITLYYEIVGYLPSGSMIQGGYDYGCTEPIGSLYTYNINYKIFVYRITSTNVDGEVIEFTAKEVQNWCNNKGLIPVKELYYGFAKDLYPTLDLETHWSNNFLDCISKDDTFYMEKNSPDCKNKVPHEGVVIRIENNKPSAFKVKCLKFVAKESKQLDNGESNIEDES